MNKQIAIGSSIGFALLLILGTTIFWGIRNPPKQHQSLARSISPTVSTDDSASSLDVESSSAVPLGNLTGGESNAGSNTTSSTGIATTNQGEPSAASSSSTSNATSSSQTNAFDPSTFQQYDKYKDSKATMFGDTTVGTGTTATASKTIVVSYRGWLTNGQLFDQNVSSDKPFSFVLGAHSVIPGWEEGIDGMKVGGERMLIVPPAVGYGTTANGPIPANSVLIFDVKLLDVK